MTTFILRPLVSALLTTILAFTCFAAVPAHPPGILVQPRSATLVPGLYMNLGATLNGTPPFTYQWRRNGAPLAGENAALLQRDPVSAADGGDYVVVVSNAFGSVTSAVARVIVNPLGPGFSSEGGDLFACSPQFSDLVFHVVAEGAPPISLQWQRNGTNLPGQTRNILALSGPESVPGHYRAVAWNSSGYATSRVMRLVIDPPSPIFPSPLESGIYPVGTYLEMTPGVFYCGDYTAYWRFNGVPIAGSTNTGYTGLSIPYFSAEGDYDCVLNYGALSVTSPVATLIATQFPPVIVSQSYGAQTVLAGNTAYFSVVVNAGPLAAIQWHFQGAPIAGATNQWYQFVTSSTNQSGSYFAVATNIHGAATSQVVTLNVRVQAPTITLQPFDRPVVAGGAAQLIASGYGYPGPQLQWRHNAVDLPGATNWSWEILMTSTNDAGDYAMVAWNEGGAVTSRVARLTVLRPGPLDRWQWRRPLPQGNDLWAAAFGNDAWVVVGRGGTVLRSADAGLTWQSTNLGSYRLTSVAYGNGAFVAGGGTEDGIWKPVLFASTNGTDWVHRQVDSSNSVYAVYGLAFGNGRFVATLTTRDVCISTNGMDWAWHSTGGTAPDAPAFGNGLFFDTSVSSVVTSADGITWTQRALSTPGDWTSHTSGDGRFVLGGVSNPDGNNRRFFTMSSSNAIDWTTNFTTLTNAPRTLAFGGGRWVTAFLDPSNSLATSPDLLEWTPQPRPLTNEIMFLNHANGQFLMGGNYGNLLSSSNGSNWTVHSGGSPDNLRAVESGNHVTVAIGNEGMLFTSTDHRTWTRRDSGTTRNLRGVAWGRGRFVVSGDNGTLLISTNGESWSRVESPSSSGFFNIAFSGDTFVAVGEAGAIVWSRDGLAWSNAVSGTAERLNAVAWTGDRFLAVGRSQTICYSTDGRNWTGATFEYNGATFFQGVAAGNGRAVAVGQNGLVNVSTNGVHWLENRQLVDMLGNFALEDLTFAHGQFVACGENGFLASSPDGWIWTKHFTGCRNNLRGIRWIGGRLLAAGNNETIIESDFFGPPRLRAQPWLEGGDFALAVTTEAGQPCRLESSEDLVHWTEVLASQDPDGGIVLVDPGADQVPARFYRVVALETEP